MKFSFVVPIYNDGSLAEDFITEFENVFQQYLSRRDISEEVELLFINDGSTNNSINDLIICTEKHSFVKVIDLSRNFGQHIALSCGYSNAKGMYVGMLNVDMQDPPSEIPKMITYMDMNALDIVYGLVAERKTSILNDLTSKLFGIVLNFLTKNKTPLNVTTLRIMNRKFVNAYNQFSEKSRYIPGLEVWLGFKSGYIEIKHQHRQIGKSSYNFSKRLKMAIDSIVSFSDYPLKLISSFGLIISFVGFLLSIHLIISKLFFHNYQAGYTSTICIVTLIGGINILVVGFSALYIGRILKEVQNRPLYIINGKYNF
jgi:glycosyltransferase involved in cell wall biosynthesis